MAALENAVRFGGFVMAHAVWIVSDLAEGELLCPIAVVTQGDGRKVIPFEAATQAEAIERGKFSFEQLRSSVDTWALAREGYYALLGSDRADTDVLTISSWAKGLDEPLTLRQLFLPAGRGGFSLIGPISVSIHGVALEDPIQSKFLSIAMEGVLSHPRGGEWERWCLPKNKVN
jgi:hypothetical protein